MFRFAWCLQIAFALPAVTIGDEPDRAAIRKKMELAMGPLPGPDRKVPLDVKVVSEEKLDGYVRKKVTFAVEKGDRVPAWLLIPTRIEGKRPAMLCLHQTIAIGKDDTLTGRRGLDRKAHGQCPREPARQVHLVDDPLVVRLAHEPLERR